MNLYVCISDSSRPSRKVQTLTRTSSYLVMVPLISYCAKLGSGSGSYTICTCASLGRVRVCLANRFEFAAKWFAECNMLCRFTPNVPATQLIRRCGFLALWSGATTNISICSRAADHPPSTKATTRATSSFYASADVNAATTDIFAVMSTYRPTHIAALDSFPISSYQTPKPHHSTAHPLEFQIHLHHTHISTAPCSQLLRPFIINLPTGVALPPNPLTCPPVSCGHRRQFLIKTNGRISSNWLANVNKHLFMGYGGFSTDIWS